MVTGTDAFAVKPAESFTLTSSVYLPVTGLGHLAVMVKPLIENPMPMGTPEMLTE
jgi:hypothetical protein